METLLGTKFAVRKILLLMISGIFLVGVCLSDECHSHRFWN